MSDKLAPIMTRKYKQKGSALVISLILIFVGSILGITVMKSSILGFKLSENYIAKNEMLQHADSASQIVALDKHKMQTAYNDNGEATSYPIAELSEENLNVTASYRYTGEGIAMGSSVKLFKTLRFESEGKAESPSNGAISEVRQGVVRIIPTINQ